jgi:fructokinase
MVMSKGKPVILGEVLFDRFSDGIEVLGGAPFNVAWHLKGFGLAPLFISRVGDDDAGRKVLEAMERWDLDQTGIRVDSTYPTGAVDISFVGNDHRFDILPDQAYDHISWDQVSSLSQLGVGLLYQGTLIMRTQHMRNLLMEMHNQVDLPVFVDLNLRAPWWRQEALNPLLNRATWVKVNKEELDVVADGLGCPREDVELVAASVAALTGISLLIVTFGQEGAMAVSLQGETFTVAPEEADHVVDTVGAGDAFSSVVILGLLCDWPLEITMRRAQEFASQIVKQRGATSLDAALYRRMLDRWKSCP